MSEDYRPRILSAIDAFNRRKVKRDKKRVIEAKLRQLEVRQKDR